MVLKEEGSPTGAPQHPYGSDWFLGTAGIYCGAMLFLVTAVMLTLTATHMLKIKAKADHAAAVARTTDMVVQSVADLNAGGRAWLVLRDPAIATERSKIRAAVHIEFSQLLALTADDPAQHAAVEHAILLSKRRIALFDAMLASAGPPGTTVVAGEAERGKANRASYRALSAIRDDANAVFERHQNEMDAEMRLCVVLALFAGIGSPVCGLMGIFLLRRDRDSQQIRELRAEMMLIERTAIIGETAAMLAHEINQPLTAGANFLTALRNYIAQNDIVRAVGASERIGQQITRARAILRKLTRFIEKRENERALQDPSVLAEDAETLIATIDNTIVLKTDCERGLPLVLADRVQIQQVLVNLMRNAAEAMTGQPERVLTLSVRSASPSTVEISLADTGPGLVPAVAEKLFQPFVSTKKSGMGVGLSICHSIITQHGGHIWADPNPKGGTIFHFTLPVAEARAAA